MKKSLNIIEVAMLCIIIFQLYIVIQYLDLIMDILFEIRLNQIKF